MHMALMAKPWTRGDLELLPNDGKRYEIIHGELFVSPAPAPRMRISSTGSIASWTPTLTVNGLAERRVAIRLS